MGRSKSRKKATLLRHSQIRSKAQAFRADGPKPAFVADVMLGRLARWLRIAGFDVLYSNRYHDDELVALSHQQGRILLSRDTRLLVRKTVSCFIFLESESVRMQLRQVFAFVHATSLPEVLSRCLSCNEVLDEIPRESVRERVPPYVFETQDRFKSCPGCRKIYWAGTHRRSMMRTFEQLLDGGSTC